MGWRRPSFQVMAIVLGAAMVAAPFLALLYHPVAGLAVMALALVATALLARDVVASSPSRLRGWLNAAIVMNIVFAIACVAAAVWFLRGA
ncbi:MAG: hypothetical protein U0031_08970 [Thermomicrobiales bacterium]